MRRVLNALLCLLVAACAVQTGAQAGTAYTQAVGNPPVCTSLAFRGWMVKLLNWRLTECPLTRATTYYFDNVGGSDANAGTLAAPYATLAKAQSVLSANPSGNIALAFKCGDVWHETQIYAYTLSASPATGQAVATITAGTFNPGAFYAGQSVTLTGGTNETLTVSSFNTSTGAITFTANIANAGHTGAQFTAPSQLLINEPNVTLTSYSTGRKPLIDGFQAHYTGTWQTSTNRADSFNRTYSRTENNQVGWFREEYDARLLYWQLDSIAHVDATPGSWWWDSSGKVLYMHPFDDRNPNSDGRNYQACYPSGNDGIKIGTGNANDAGVDGVRINGIRIDGYGIGTAANATYCIHGNVGGTNSLLISNCEAYYGGKHNIGNTAAGGESGGYFTVLRCRAGMDVDDTTYVCYAPNGLQEFLLVNDECVSGNVPVGVQPFPFQGGGGAATMHSSNNTTFPTSLCICWGCKTLPNQWQPSAGFGTIAQNAPTFTDLVNCRVFDVDETFQPHTISNIDTNIQTYALTSASQAATTVTITAPPSVTKQQPQTDVWARLSGGTSTDEWIEVSSYSAGLVTFGTTIAGAARTSIAYPVGFSTQGGNDNILPTNLFGIASCVMLNCKINGSAYWNVNTPTLGMMPADTGGICINCSFTWDDTQMPTHPTFHRTFGIVNGGIGAAWEMYNCQLHLMAHNYVDCAVDLRPMAFNVTEGAQADSVIAKNCIFSADTGGTSSAFNVGLNNNVVSQTGSVSSSTDTTHFVSNITTLPANTYSSYSITFSSSTTTTALRSQTYALTSFTNSTGAIVTASAMAAQPVSGDTFQLNAQMDKSVTAQLLMVNNAYCGVSTKTGIAGYDQDPFYVEMPGAQIFGSPLLDSSLLSTHEQKIRGYHLDYDANWMPRPPAGQSDYIGPYRNPLPAIIPTPRRPN